MIIQWQAVSTSSQAVVMGRPALRSSASTSADTPTAGAICESSGGRPVALIGQIGLSR